MTKYTLNSTTDYGKFELCQFNRDVKKTKFLRQSMKEHGFIPAYPLHCSKSDRGKLQIKAGHHRFEIAQELGLPVFYVVSDDDATIHELEKATTSWGLSDYLNSFVRCGYGDYAQVKEYHERTGIPLRNCISILAGESAGSDNHAARFRYGQYKVASDNYADQIADLVLFCKEHGIRSSDSIFVQAISRCVVVDEFSPEIFKTRVRYNAASMKPCRTLQEQIAMIESVYNLRTHEHHKIPLTFLIQKKMNERALGGKLAKSKRGNK